MANRKKDQPSNGPPKPYDAQKYNGIMPGLAKRMAGYLKHMRDDRDIDDPRKKEG
jgi:hypothetical protein